MTRSERPDPSASRELELLHFVPGRIRTRFHRLKGNQTLAGEVRNKLSAAEGVEGVEASHLTGTVLIRYEPNLIQWESVLSIAVELNLLPKSISKSNLIRTWQAYALQSR
jgi:hypothetical protein